MCSWGPSMLHFLMPFPRSVPRHNPVSELYGQFLRPHGFVFALTCTYNCGTLYRQVCAFPYHVQSIEFTSGGLQSSCRNISRMINGNRMYLSSISSLTTNGRKTYVNQVGQLRTSSHLQLRPGQDRAKQCDTNNTELHMG